MSQSGMFGPWKRRCREHRQPRFLPNTIREAPSIPVRHVRTDILLDQVHAVLTGFSIGERRSTGSSRSESRVSVFPRSPENS